MAIRRESAAIFISPLLACILASPGHGHGLGAWAAHPLDWGSDQISQVIAVSGQGRKVSIAGKDCIAGSMLVFNVRDEYAFDIDETVWLDIDFYNESGGATVSLSYDGDGSTLERNTSVLDLWSASGIQVEIPKGDDKPWHRKSIALNRARFANLGFAGSDFAMRALAAAAPLKQEMVICDISLRRSHTTPVPIMFGWTSIEVVDEHGRETPARIGIYDSSERLLLPSDEAVPLRYLNGRTRIVPLGPGAAGWPVKNRNVFYTDGRYRTRIPPGEYELVVAKGPEYRISRRHFTIAKKNTTAIQVRLKRWRDMAADRWYSGEDHVHYPRDSSIDDHNLQLFTQAEDLRVTSILQMDNVVRGYFPHYDWTPVVLNDHAGVFVLAPGQEGPRSAFLGHTLQLNINESIRDSEHYLLYHKVFERAHAQGGLSGYAHVVDQSWKMAAMKGMAIDMPFGLVDFAEVMSMHWVGTSVWFDFLNLGYKLPPSAGTDYPWGDVPGTVRNYVQVDQPFSSRAWFDELKRGRTFVTSGPMLEISINGQGVGSEIRVKRGQPLAIKAKASMNPDIDVLAGLELIEQGTVIKGVTSPQGLHDMELHHQILAKHGTWFVLRARGKSSSTFAFSGPVYVIVDGETFWKCSEVPQIVTKLKHAMEEVLMPVGPEGGTEPWETQEPLANSWKIQKNLLKERIEQANVKYDELLLRASTSSDCSGSTSGSPQ